MTLNLIKSCKLKFYSSAAVQQHPLCGVYVQRPWVTAYHLSVQPALSSFLSPHGLVKFNLSFLFKAKGKGGIASALTTPGRCCSPDNSSPPVFMRTTQTKNLVACNKFYFYFCFLQSFSQGVCTASCLRATWLHRDVCSEELSFVNTWSILPPQPHACGYVVW